MMETKSAFRHGGILKKFGNNEPVFDGAGISVKAIAEQCSLGSAPEKIAYLYTGKLK